MINFEKPVLDKFSELYGDIDPRTLPLTDRRLTGVWCEFMTSFMRKLRREIDRFAGRRVLINVICGFSPESSRTVGLDVETWAKEGLIDSVCQDTMELYEDIEDCMNGESIDLGKYSEKLKTTEIVKRFFGYDLDKICDGAKKYMEICTEYGVKFYGGIFSWHRSPKNVLENQKTLKELGSDNFSVFNYGQVVRLPFHHVLAHVCHDSINEEYTIVRNFRVQSIDGYDISLYNPNWRG